MTSGRATKRARQKQRRAARLQVWTAAYRKRRRQRLVLLLGSLAVILIGTGIVFLAKNPFADKKKPVAAATPKAATAPIKRPVACDAKVPKTAGGERQNYPKAGNAHLVSGKNYVWKLDTSCGEIDIALDTKHDPKTTNSIVWLTKKHFFDGLFFHRISASVSVIQGGDPTGNGIGGPGYSVVEPPPDSTKYTRGIVAMAKNGTEPPGASGSQFFIVFGDGAKELPKDYAVVGEVTNGMSVVDKISKTGKTDESPAAFTYIERATVVAE